MKMVKISSFKIHIIAILLVILAGFIVYANSLGNDFVYDDCLVVEDKPFLSSLGNIKGLFTEDYFVGSGEFTYRPLVTLTYMVDYYFSGDNPFGYHLTNILLHVFNAALLYLFLIVLLPLIFGGREREVIPVAFLSGIIFCVHPVQTEVVNAVAFREELLMVGSALISLICFIKSEGMKRPLFSILSLLFFFTALQTKETMLVVPFLAILTDVAVFKGPGRSFLKRLVRYIPAYLAVIAVYFCINFFWAHALLEKANMSSPEQYLKILGSPFISLLTSARIFVGYIGLFLFPAQLLIDRIIIPARSLFEPSIFGSSVVLLGMLAFFVYKYRNNRLVFFSGLWFFISLLPVTNIVPLNLPMAERYLYLPSIGYSLLLAWAIAALYFRVSSAKVKGIIAVAVVLLICGYSLRTITRNRDWKDDFSLWYKELMNPPSSERTYVSVASGYFEKKMYAKAIEYYKHAIELSPDYNVAYNGLGRSYFELGMYNKALEVFQSAIKSGDIDYVHMHNNMGRVYSVMGDYEKARQEFEQVIELNPYHFQAYNNLGTVYSKQGDFTNAAECYKKALELKPSNSTIRVNLGSTYFRMGDLDQAEEIWKDTVKRDPGSVAAHQNLAVLYEKKGLTSLADKEWQNISKDKPESVREYESAAYDYFERGMYDQAMEYYKRAIKIDPDNKETHNELGRVYSAMREYEQAREEFKKAIGLDRRYFKAYNNMGTVCFKEGSFKEAVEYYGEALELAPSSITVRVNMGLAYFRMGDLDNAEQTWRDVTRMDPDSLAAHQNLAVLYGKKEMPSLAIEEWKSVLRIDPGNAQARSQLLRLENERI